MVALIISLPVHFSSWNLIIYSFSIEISTGPIIKEDLHDGVGISLGAPVGGFITQP